MDTMDLTKPLTAGLVSTDPAFRAAVRELLGEDEFAHLPLSVEISHPFSQIGADQVKGVRDADPAVFFLDLRSDAGTGLRFAHFLAEQNPRRQVVAVGGTPSTEALFAAMQAGVTEYVPEPAGATALAEPLRRALRKLGAAGGSSSLGRLLSVFSVKGGSGCTTVATNLAIQLHKLTGKRTLLLDLDLELGETAVHLGVQPRFHFVDMIRNFHRMDADLLASYIERHETGVHLLSAPFQPERAEAVTGEQVRSVLRFLRQHYPFVVVDTPKTFSPAATATLQHADTVFLVATVDLPTLRNLKRSLPLLDRITGQAAEKVRLVVNRQQDSTPITLDEVERSVGMPVAHTLANDYEAVSAAINTARPVVLNGRSAFARDLRTFAAHVAGISPNGKSRGPLVGRLGKLFGRKESAGHV